MTVDTNSEEHRHRCEVRWCLRNGRAWFDNYIKGVAEKRGRWAARRLYDDVKDQAALGNSGLDGRWEEPKNYWKNYAKTSG